MKLPTACPLDCPDRCAMTATVDGDRLTALQGSPRSPWTAGYICQKVHDFPARVHGPHRVATPLRRTSAKGEAPAFTPISWTEAIALLAGHMRALLDGPGPGAIQPVWYGGSNGLLTGGGLDARLWARLGVRRLDRTLCAANNGAAADRVWPGMPAASQADVDHAQTLVLWGMNPQASGIHLQPPIKRLRDRGGALIVVDPRRTRAAAAATLHLPILPGTDHALARALLHIALRDGHVDWDWIEARVDGARVLADRFAAWPPARAAAECDVPVGHIEEMARLYAQGSPSFLRCGWGAERNRRATAAYDAILMLPAFYRQVGRRGAGYALSTSAGYGIDKSRYLGPATPSPWAPTNLSRLAHTLHTADDPRIELVYVYNCNPVATVPDQRALIDALRAPRRFVVVHEQVWTDTCDEADLVLPATTFAEHHELSKSYGGYDLHWSPPVIPPVGEARSNHAVMAALGAALGLGPDFQQTETELAKQIVTTAFGPAAWDQLQRDHILLPPAPVQWTEVTPTRRPDWSALAPEIEAPARDAHRPLALITPASPQAITSTGFESIDPAAIFLDMAPADAATRGLSTGQAVAVESSLGRIELRLRVDPDLRPGVVSLPKGLWRRHTLNGWTGAALAPPEVDPIGQGACYNDARVDVFALPDPEHSLAH